MGIESAVFFLFFAAVFILLFFAVAGAALFFRRFNENTKYIESNIRRARDKGAAVPLPLPDSVCGKKKCIKGVSVYFPQAKSGQK